jgi:hypothetical protein
MSLHTHYDNLKVSRKAPIEVIRASYKALAQKYHPDLNDSSAEAQRIMTVINQSYAVLSDTNQRAEHDAWIVLSETAPAQPTAPAKPPPPDARPYTPPAPPAPPPRPPIAPSEPAPIIKFIAHVFNYWIIYLGLAIWIWYANTNHTPSESSAKQAYSAPAKPKVSKPAYIKPTGSPRGYLWPQGAGYVHDYQILAQGGLSTVTIDNSSNDNDVFVKLVSLEYGAPLPVRHFFIPARGQFTLQNVLPGNYDIRYKDLDSGQLARSESFILKQVRDEEGTTYSNLRMTLYKVRNGNMQTYGINDADFGD